VRGANGKAVSAKTVWHIHELFRNVLNWGVRRELLSRNVAALVEGEDLPKNVTPKPVGLTAAELHIVLNEAKNPPKRAAMSGYASAQPWFYPALAFAAYTGARRGEVLAIRWSDIRFDEMTATIARSLTEELKFKSPKNDKARTISMPAQLVTILQIWRAEQAKGRLLLGSAYSNQDLVFAQVDGSCIDPAYFSDAARNCVKRAGVTPITLHGMRDTHASLLAKAGVPIEVIKDRLGHSSISVTVERYLDVYPERDALAAEAFDRLLG